ncbi:hypothetical protein ISF_09051 [Cordyceps fumosorosea ARSEF 2679]|uniref:Integral membrane protein n=1 Tax=Cordyceps fumosorosea (strain ARSEF 2679) TaxID=1081104 RepID=A0A167LHF1_CORFA|nr:hypothetical protein ISF_09051 [Cordyceps fumosorosea ARSEF 2679]OAA53097.1 hypothetical protein ISF_09051 [Cordyceps fumosorosea ARSEF 2679]
MPTFSQIATGLVAAEHVYILVLEMFLWTTPRGLRTFKMDRDLAEKTKVLAANQGLYNGFLAAGLAWSLLHPAPGFAHQLQLFFLSNVVLAGAYGGATATKKIWTVQMMPGLASFALTYFGL